MMLLASSSDGSYLVRGSRSKPGDFVLSVRTGKEVSHVMIECKVSCHATRSSVDLERESDRMICDMR